MDNIGQYNDQFQEFDCGILACSVNGDKYMILNLDENIVGWCSTYLVNDECFAIYY